MDRPKAKLNSTRGLQSSATMNCGLNRPTYGELPQRAGGRDGPATAAARGTRLRWSDKHCRKGQAAARDQSNCRNGQAVTIGLEHTQRAQPEARGYAGYIQEHNVHS